jgi:hypothetical protein
MDCKKMAILLLIGSTAVASENNYEWRSIPDGFPRKPKFVRVSQAAKYDANRKNDHDNLTCGQQGISV